MRVLIIEDNHSTAQTIELALTKEGMQCDRAELGEEGLEVSRLTEYDIILLDINLPDISGYEVLKTLRTQKKQVPVLILSALNGSEDKIKGLGFGADDFLSKPFNMGELLARVNAVVRRFNGFADTVITVKDLKINTSNHTAHAGEKPLYLTSKEQVILELLATKHGNTVHKEQFLSHLYNDDNAPDTKIIDVFVCKLRKKIHDATGENYIQTAWGRGYSLKRPEEIPLDKLL